jgi:DNA-binding MarR family transcriptional regulator
VSTLVNQLAAAGLVRRRVDPEDRRVARLELTAAARERLRRWRANRARLVGAALTRLPEADVRAVEAALPALRRLLQEVDDQ